MAAATKKSNDLLTTAQAANRLGVAPWRLRRLLDSGMVKAPRRLGQNRIIEESELEELREACRKAGYIR